MTGASEDPGSYIYALVQSKHTYSIDYNTTMQIVTTPVCSVVRSPLAGPFYGGMAILLGDYDVAKVGESHDLCPLVTGTTRKPGNVALVGLWYQLTFRATTREHTPTIDRQ